MSFSRRVAGRALDFDILHFHIAQIHFPIVRRLPSAHVTTLHGRLDLPELVPFFNTFREIPVVSISNAQRRPLLQAHWVKTIYHGLPPDRLQFQAANGHYLAFLGRISPEKRLDRAIAIAQACGIPLHVAAKVDPADVEYFEREIRPLLNDPLVHFIGEIGDEDKARFLGDAIALIFPIDWPEPFGLVMIEAMACGTPIVAFNHGSVPEVVEDGVTGYAVESVEEAIAATARVGTLDRRACRAAFEKRFTVSRMADEYVALYEASIHTQRATAARYSTRQRALSA